MKTQNLIFVPRISYGPTVFKYKQNILKLYFKYSQAFVETTFLYDVFKYWNIYPTNL